MLKQTEHQIQTVILQYLRLKQFKVWRCNSGRTIYESKGIRRMVTYGERGIPDIMAIKNGELFCIEVKGPKGKTTPHQDMWLDDAKAHGAICGVCRSVDDVISLIGSST